MVKTLPAWDSRRQLVIFLLISLALVVAGVFMGAVDDRIAGSPAATATAAPAPSTTAP